MTGGAKTPPADAAMFSRAFVHRHSGLNFVHISRHQLDARVLESPAGAVVHGDPADDFDDITFLWRHDVVVGLPAHSTGDVGELGGKFSAFIRGNHPLQARLQNRLGRQVGKDRGAGKAEAQLPADFNDRFLWRSVSLVVAIHVERIGANIAAADDFALHRGVVGEFKVDGATFV